MSDIKEVYFLDYYNSLLNGDKTRCGEIVLTLVEQGVDIKDIYTSLLQKAMYRIGKLWEQGRVSIAEEHIASQITKGLVNLLFTRYQANKHKELKVIITCVDKEFHDIGAVMVSHIFELNGWDTFYLGASTPSREVIKLIEIKKPNIVGLSLSLYMNIGRLIDVVDEIKAKYPDMTIIIGGQGIAEDDKLITSRHNRVFSFASLNELDAFLVAEYAQQPEPKIVN